MENIFNATYWSERYKNDNTPWDIGYPSTPIAEFADSIPRKDCKILIPGCGNAYEADYFYKQGFTEIYLLDWSADALAHAQERLPQLPKKHFIQADYFEHTGQYDYIIEQTFFCAFPRHLRRKYAATAQRLLQPKGILAGLLFNDADLKGNPPFGGTKAEYKELFAKYFTIHTLAPCYNSIRPRAGRELFCIFEAKPINTQ